MSATSKTQQQVMAIAEHAPGKLYSRNRGLLKMTHQQLHDFASTSRKGLPKRKHKASSSAKTTVGGLMGHVEPDEDD
jgi:hypothetical protein